MACYHPLKGFQVGWTASGKKQMKITSYLADHVEIDSAGHAVAAYQETRGVDCVEKITEFEEIPCGRCIGCRLAYSRQWADRCMLELPYHEQSWFVTLTYDDEHIPLNEVMNPETGEINQNATLVKRDVQLFMKRLRRYYPHDNAIKYFFAGEYGSQTYRPHYHAILFGLKLDDLKLYKMSGDGYNYYNSPFLDKCWKKGFVVVGNVTWDTCAYTARYIMKKQYGSAVSFYEENNIVPEFTLMSRKPAIGRRYYDENVADIYWTNKIYIGTDEGSHEIQPPRYYDKLYDIDYPSDMDRIKSMRKEVADSYKQIKMQSTSLPYLQQLEVEEQAKLAAISTLKRKEL